MSKVTKVTPMLQGHTRVEYEDGSQSIVQRGAPVPTVGVDYASSQQSTAPSDGDSGASSVETQQEESRLAENEQEPTARLRSDLGEEAAGAQEEKQDGPQAS